MARWQVVVLALEAGEDLVLHHAQHRLDAFLRLAATLLGVATQPLDHIARGAAADAEIAAPIAQHVERADALGDVERVVQRHEDDGEAEADAFRLLRDGGKHHLGAGAVPDLDEEMLLGDPEMVEAGRSAATA